MTINLFGKTKYTAEINKNECEIRNKNNQLVLLCTVQPSSAQHITAADVCQEVEQLVLKHTENNQRLTEVLTHQEKLDICSKISTELKSYSKKVKLIFENKRLNIKPQISLEMFLFFSDFIALFHIGDARSYSSKKGEFALLTRDQNNLNTWVEQNGTNYDEGKKEPDAFDLTNGIGFSGVLMVEPKSISLGIDDKFLVISQSVRRFMRSIKLKAILQDTAIQDIPRAIFQELEQTQAKGAFGVLAFEAPPSNNKLNEKNAWGFLERFSIIKKSLLFAELNEEESVRLLSICKTTQVPSGDYIIREGSNDREMFFVLDGSLEVRVHQVKIRNLGPGDIIGEMAAFTNEPRSADVVTLQLCYFMVFDYQSLMNLLHKETSIAYKVHRAVIQILSDKIRMYNAKGASGSH